jgi:hypothetical protein
LTRLKVKLGVVLNIGNDELCRLMNSGARGEILRIHGFNVVDRGVG